MTLKRQYSEEEEKEKSYVNALMLKRYSNLSNHMYYIYIKTRICLNKELPTIFHN
jgi:hypothetical protein